MADIAITVANVQKGPNSSITTFTAAAGVTITQGQALYLVTQTTVGLADSNGTAPLNSFCGFALNAAAPLQPVSFVAIDAAYETGATTPLTSGAVIYLSNTAGAITATYSDIASGSTVIALGVVNTGGTLNLSPVVGGVK